VFSVIGRVMTRTGSASSAGLLRILLALLVWAQWAGPMRGIHLMGEIDRLAVSAIFWVVTPFMLLGWYSRTSTAVVGLGLLANHVVSSEFTRFHGVDRDPWFLVVAVCLLALTPCGAAFSVDRWRARRRGIAPARAEGALWAWPLLTVHLVIMHLSMAVAMAQPVFLNGTRLHQHLMYTTFGSVSPGWLEPACALAAPVLLVANAALALGYVVPRLRTAAVGFSVVFHSLLFVVLPAGVYTLYVMAMGLAVLDPEAVHRAIDRLQGRAGPS